LITHYPLSEYAITFQFGNVLSEEVYQIISRLNFALSVQPFDGFIESVPAYTTLTVFYNPLIASEYHLSGYDYICSYVSNLLNTLSNSEVQKEDIIEIPICFDAEFAIDLPFIAQEKGLTEKEVVDIFLSRTYKTYMMGFLPGFAYMGEVHPSIAIGRKATPRSLVEEGSVGIAGMQTGIYPINSPGGWQIVGRTPLNIFDINRKDAILFKSGDRIQFYAISKEEYFKIKQPIFKESEAILSPDVVLLKGGVYTTIQDSGRKGYRAFGVPVGGAMDVLSHYEANAIVGNDMHDATLENTMGGLILVFKTKTYFAVSGSGKAFLNGTEIEYNFPHKVKEEDVLEVKYNGVGFRTYIAVKGGFVSKKIMESRSAIPKIGFGELLTKNHYLKIGKPNNKPFKSFPKREINTTKSIRIFTGNEADWLTDNSKQSLLSTSFRISNKSDRMGYHLESEPLELKEKIEMLSTAVCPGTVQLTPNGQLIVLMNDCQTTGGYPRVGQVAEVDLSVLAQMKSGDVFNFELISRLQAEQLLINQMKIIHDYYH
jgi:KipI family sensor histidine kinase inhibitor